MKFTYTIRKAYRYIMVQKAHPEARVIEPNDIPDAPMQTELKDAGPNSYYQVTETRVVELRWYKILWYMWNYLWWWRYKLVKDLTRNENLKEEEF